MKKVLLVLLVLPFMTFSQSTHFPQKKPTSKVKFEIDSTTRTTSDGDAFRPNKDTVYHLSVSKNLTISGVKINWVSKSTANRCFSFRMYVEMSNDTISCPINWAYCSFPKGFDAISDIFQYSVNLRNESVAFLSMQDNKFYNNLDLGSSSIRDSKIQGNIFKGKIDFGFSKFSSDFSFDYNIMEETSSIDFIDAQLPQYIYFTNNTIKSAELVDFTKADFSKDSTIEKKNNVKKIHWINLENTDISKIKIDYVHFRLFFSDYEKDENKANELKETVYQGLLGNFKQKGQEESYKNLDIEYQYFKFDKLKLSWVGDFFYYWWQFGYAKELIFKWVWWFLFIYTSINFAIINFLKRHVYHIDTVPYVRGFYCSKRPFNKLLIRRAKKIFKRNSAFRFYLKQFRKRLWFSFAYTTSVFFTITLKLEKLKFTKWYGSVYLMLIYSSGLLCLAYLANYVLNK